MWPLRKKIGEAEWERRNALVVEHTRDNRLDEALPLARALAEDARSSFGRHHPHTMTALNNLGLLHVLRQEFDQAEVQLLAALEACEHVHGKASRESAVINDNLARLFQRRAERIRHIDEAFGND